MTVSRKAVLRSVRLDDDVWAAVKGMECSLNQYLREALLGGGSNGAAVAEAIVPVDQSARVDPATIPGVSRGIAVPAVSEATVSVQCEHCGEHFDSNSRLNRRCGECGEKGHSRTRYDCAECRLNA
jgi:hypothetical protein